HRLLAFDKASALVDQCLALVQVATNLEQLLGLLPLSAQGGDDLLGLFLDLLGVELNLFAAAIALGLFGLQLAFALFESSLQPIQPGQVVSVLFLALSEFCFSLGDFARPIVELLDLF